MREVIGSGFGVDGRDNLLTMIYADVMVLRKAIIRWTSHLFEFGAKMLHELFPVDGNARLLAR